MTNHQINYIIWIPLLVSAIGLPVVFLTNLGSTLGTASLSRVCTAFTIPSWRRAK
jgi:hypothetical protein